MKKIIILVFVLLGKISYGQIVDILDANFKNALVNTKCVDIDGNGHGDADADLNNDGEIQLSEAEIVTSLNVGGNSISSLEGIINFTNLARLHCSYNNLRQLDLSNLLSLQIVDCSSNYSLSQLDLSNLPKLFNLDCSSNILFSLEISNLNSLIHLNCSGNNLSQLYLSDLPSILTVDCSSNKLTILDMSNLPKLHDLTCSSNQLSEIFLNNLPSLYYLSISDNLFTQFNILTIPSLSFLLCGGNKLTELYFNNLPNLISLFCSDNKLSKLDLSNLPYLSSLTCDNNLLTQLDLSKVKYLSSLSCFSNKLTLLNMSELLYLKFINCENNQIKKLDLSNLIALNEVNCSGNAITQIQLQSHPELKYFYCYSNKITKLDLTKLPSLAYFNCGNNRIFDLDLSHIKLLKALHCFNNPLNFLFVKTGGNIQLEFSGPDTISYICTDNHKIAFFHNLYPNAEVNSYCTFTPGGKFYSILGEAKYDIDNNGCNASDTSIPNLKYKITNGTISGSLITNEFGQYSISVQEGSHTITPTIENPQFFDISPPTLTVTFPNSSDTVFQNFCITPKDVYHKVDITILPLTPSARPGFEAKYKVVITSKGNQRENGTLNFTYDEILLDYVNADVNPTTQSDGLVAWDFNDLLPFETRTFTVTLKVNKPTDTPPVNVGDVLQIVASILDNVFVLKNTVVGSIDPNDKTCLEGDKITPDMIGKFVHYLIRFENTGTYAAQNVVVKDIIDEAVFDLASLQITDASHREFTRINGNVVEFIFDGIQLPFDDATNDGYIAFKIKTKPTLKLGDELKNKANIYFDYNFPIVTNVAKSVIANTVNTNNLASNSELIIYPNPAGDYINIGSAIDVIKVNIYDLAGRILQSSGVVNNQVDVKLLGMGTYMVKLYTKEGVSVGKMVKG